MIFWDNCKLWIQQDNPVTFLRGRGLFMSAPYIGFRIDDVIYVLAYLRHKAFVCMLENPENFGKAVKNIWRRTKEKFEERNNHGT